MITSFAAGPLLERAKKAEAELAAAIGRAEKAEAERDEPVALLHEVSVRRWNPYRCDDIDQKTNAFLDKFGYRLDEILALDAKNDLVRSYRDFAHNLQTEVDELRDENRELRATVADLQESYSDKPKDDTPSRHLKLAERTGRLQAEFDAAKGGA
jgi:hypothetical protein